MPGKQQKADNWHLSLSLQKDLWDRLLHAALPIKVAKGEFDLVRNMRSAVKALDVKQRVKGLLEDHATPVVMKRAQERAIALWRERRGQINELIDDLIQIEGTWRVQLDQEGSEFQYGRQQIGVKAQVRVVAEGTARLLRNNVEFPFVIEKRAAAALKLNAIQYDRQREELVGELGDILVDLGENIVLELLGRAAEFGLDRQLRNVNPLKILSRAQLEEFVSPAGGALNMQMGVDDLDLVVDGENITLKVRFGCSQKQIEDGGGER